MRFKDDDGNINPNDEFARLSNDGTQIGVVNLGVDNDGPSFDRLRRVFLNDNTAEPELAIRTLVAPKGTPALGTTVGPQVFSDHITTDAHTTLPPLPNTFLEDSKVAPFTLPPPLGGTLFVQAASSPAGDPTHVQAWSALCANSFVAEVIDDFAAGFKRGSVTLPGPLPDGSFESVGMAFDSQGDLWVTRVDGPDDNLDMQLLEFTLDPATNTFVGARFVNLTVPSTGSPVPDGNLHKVAIVAGRPESPSNHSGDTIFVASAGFTVGTGGWLFVVDEESADQVLAFDSELNGASDSRFPIGVAACDWPRVMIKRTQIRTGTPWELQVAPDGGWIDPLTQDDGAGGGPPRISTLKVEFSTPVFNQDGSSLTAASAFSITCTNGNNFPSNPCPGISSIDASNNPDVTVTLNAPIPFGEWTTLQVAVENACGVEASFAIDVAHLPDDANQSGCVQQVAGDDDPQAFEDAHNAGIKELADMNRDSLLDVRDFTEFGELWRGDLGFIQWEGKCLPPRP